VHNQRVARLHGVALAMLACASMSGTALGALLVFGRAGTYPPPNAALGLSAASDQQLAGLLMSMVPMVGLLLVMARVVLDALAPHPATTAVPAPMGQRGDQLDLST